MTALLTLLPCGVVVVAILIFRLSGLVAAGLSLACALALWASGVFADAEILHLRHALLDALVLELLVGVVVFLGLLFVVVSGRGGGLNALGAVVAALGLSIPRTVILIALGIGVAVESLTGYGVSMLVTVPLLLWVVDRTRTIRLALIGMSLMSWGALSVATLLGAEIAGLATPVLAAAILKTSGPVAAVLPFVCLIGMTEVRRSDISHAFVAAGTLVAGIAVTSYWIGVEVAGVGGGLAVILSAIATSGSGRDVTRIVFSKAMLPYGLLIAGVVLQKAVIPFCQVIGFNPEIATPRVAFRIVESPGVALLVVSVISILIVDRSGGGAMVRQTIGRSWRPLAGILLFLLTARILVEIGGIASLAETLSHLGAYFGSVVVTLMAGVGAFATGSGVTSNALFMSSAVTIGENLDAPVLFAALQHSGSAHMAMASLPVIAILVAAMPESQPGDEGTAMRQALGLAGIWLTIVVASGWVQLALRG
jgi:lactate permease